MRTKQIKGEMHSQILLLVTARDGLGRPIRAKLGYDDTTFELKGGEEFITAWVPSHTIEPTTKGSA